MRIAFTGHANIENAFNKQILNAGEEYLQEVFDKVFNDIEQFIKKTYIDKGIRITIIDGMARGVDEIAALIAIKLKLPLILSVPNSVKYHKNRSHSRGIRAQAINYESILEYENIVDIHEISKYYYNGGVVLNYKYANFARNQNMVDIADVVYSYKISSYDSVGTDDCVKRAEKQHKYEGNIYNYMNFETIPIQPLPIIETNNEWII